MGIYVRGSKLWVRWRDVGGKWKNATSGFSVGQEDLAKIKYDELVASVAATERTEPPASERFTVRDYAAEWIKRRRDQNMDHLNDSSKLKNHVLPFIGDLVLAAVHRRDLVAMFRALRADKERDLAPRSIWSIHAAVAAMFRDAARDEMIATSPCRDIDERDLGPCVDRDPEWRDQALFTRDEATALISDPRIPPDRHMVYGFGLLAGMRPGEAAALRWRHWDPTVKPLGKLTVAHSYNTRRHVQKSTKDEVVRHVPVHPTLAAMLAEWRLSGWQAMYGRAPTPDDLIVPLPPANAASRRTRSGDPFRGTSYTGKQWREDDIPALGIRYREPYACKSTFITLAIEDGADLEILENYVTHTRKAQSAFRGYYRGKGQPEWEKTCAEVSKLRIVRGTLAQLEAKGAVDDDHDLVVLAEIPADQLPEYMLERARVIASAAPLDADAWDDPRGWQVEAAELAHAVVRFLATEPPP